MKDRKIKPFVDPKIRMADAILRFGSQSGLARALDLERATVSKMAKDEFVPPVHAYRLMQMDPKYFKERAIR